ncbi:hypothetical protein RintRC_4668 [Richelia intracellularis]|nr:hypothetical protein RintRC_4668 [Richelia intracellularis]
MNLSSVIDQAIAFIWNPSYWESEFLIVLTMKLPYNKPLSV